jgi:hypothetical protein
LIIWVIGYPGGGTPLSPCSFVSFSWKTNDKVYVFLSNFCLFFSRLLDNDDEIFHEVGADIATLN